MATAAKTTPTTTPREPAWKQARTWIAIGVLGISIAAVMVLGMTMIITSAEAEKSETARYVLTAVLPLFGTWVGTVLAFYFSKDNFEAATRSTKELLGIEQKLAAIGVADVLISFNDILKSQEDDDAKIVLKEWIETMDREKKGKRLPVFNTNKKARYVIHRSIITDYLASEAIAGSAKADLEKKTVKDLAAKKDLRDMIVSFGAVGKNATLDKVKAIMDQSDDTQDVFVTTNGKMSGEVIGWITNVMVDDYSTV